MGCVEPQENPGNCSVCGMKLVPQEIEEKNKEPFEKDHHHRAEDFLKKFWLCLFLTLPILGYSDLFEKIFGFKLPFFFDPNYLSLILASIVFFYGGFIFILGAYRELKARLPGMMTLIALAIITAYLYSFYAVFFQKEHIFFWELSTLITIMLLGHYFEMKAVAGAQRALKEIEKLLPDTAEIILQENKTKIIPLQDLKEGDLVLVRPGGKIPADGIVVEGRSEVNEAMITGESKPVLKEVNSEVMAGTLNGDGFLKVKVTKIGENTFLAGIMRLIQEAQASKSRLQILADVFAKYLTLVALFIGSLSFVIWLVLGKNFSFALERLVSVLVIACPHALGLAIPLVVSISTALSVKNGFLIKNRLALELARKIDMVLFDKTGTLTSGKFSVKKIISFSDLKEKEILQLAGSLNQYSQHFLAQGILEKAKNENVDLLPVENFENLSGRGVKGLINKKIYYLGGENLLKELNSSVPKIETLGTKVYLLDQDKNILGAIVLEDEIRPESKEAIKALHQMGIKTAMITGDSEEVAKSVAQELGMDEYFAQVLPQDKVEKIKILQEKGYKVMMVGDGINDAPALMQADVGVAIGAGTNVAIESAGIILIKNNPLDIVKIIKLSKATYQKMLENLFWATIYNVVALPLAGGILAFKGIFLQPAFSALLMSLSTVIVALNALRLKRINF